MKLHSQRLRAAASCIEKYKQGDILADIGTDHAYLPCFLYDRGVIHSAYACDIAPGPLHASKLTIKENHMEDAIIPLLGSGLDPIEDKKVDMVAICGMGGMTIIDILSAHPEALSRYRFFLQPNTSIKNVRRFLNAHHLKIIDEDIVEDAHHIYEIMIAESGMQELSEDDFIFGPCNRRKKTPIFIKKWTFELSIYQKILDQLPVGHPKKAQTIRMINIIKEALT